MTKCIFDFLFPFHDLLVLIYRPGLWKKIVFIKISCVYQNYVPNSYSQIVYSHNSFWELPKCLLPFRLMCQSICSQILSLLGQNVYFISPIKKLCKHIFTAKITVTSKTEVYTDSSAEVIESDRNLHFILAKMTSLSKQ